MGLDLVPLGRPKPGYEAEWNSLMDVLYADREESEAQFERRNEISIQPYEAVGAPRVGEDPEADKWMLSVKSTESTLTDAEYLEENKGYCALRLLENCDGVPAYSNGGLYEGVDETSFRGQFLKDCVDLIGEQTLEIAWTKVMWPEQAVEYGAELLQAAERAEKSRNGSSNGTRKKGWLGSMFSSRSDKVPLAEKIDILRSAGRWYIFWGRLGHPIAAWF